MSATFVSELIEPLDASFDTARMAQGEPGVPHKFRWRGRVHALDAVLEAQKNYGDCSHGSGERYVRKHLYRVLTSEGLVLRLCFQRTLGRGKFRTTSRWWVQSIEATRATVSPKPSLST
jgi:phosphoribosylglycinamide formyltransferase-1